jgi:hypothetical protein
MPPRKQLRIAMTMTVLLFSSYQIGNSATCVDKCKNAIWWFDG